MSLSSVSSSVSDDFWDANIEADLENMLWYGYGYQSWHDILSDIHIIILLEDIYVYIYTHTLYDYILQYDYIILYLYFPIDECVYIYIYLYLNYEILRYRCCEAPLHRAATSRWARDHQRVLWWWCHMVGRPMDPWIPWGHHVCMWHPLTS